MKKIVTYPNCVFAVTADKRASLVAPNPPLQKWMDGVCFEDYRVYGCVAAPGIYRADIEVWFEQGYSEGYPADGESDWDLRFTNVERISIENFWPSAPIEHEGNGDANSQ
jgi:hypothetical protein